MNQLVVLITICLTALTAVTVNGLECWDCKGNINAGCNTPFVPSLFAKKKCAPDEQVCLKLTQEVNGEVFNVRKCGKVEPDLVGKPEAMVCRDVSSAGLPTVSECLCDTDGCNGSGHLAVIPLTLMIPILIFTLLLA